MTEPQARQLKSGDKVVFEGPNGYRCAGTVKSTQFHCLSGGKRETTVTIEWVDYRVSTLSTENMRPIKKV